jgi:hypothetical protein
VKVLCPACERMAPVRAFRVEGQALHLVCDRCGTESPLTLAQEAQPAPDAAPVPAPPARVEPAPVAAAPRVVALRPVSDAVRLAAEAARTGDPFAVPDDRCPKCVGERPPDALFCPHCGLAWVNFRPEQTQVPEELARAFRHALEAWDDPARHDALLALATRTGQLPAVGRLYRLRLVAAPMDPVAQRGRDEVLRRAAAASEVMRARPEEVAGPKLARWAAILVGGVVLVLLAGLVFRLVTA